MTPVGPGSGPRSPGPVAFVGVAVIPMDRERVLEHQAVLVENGRITTIGPAATTRIPPGATRIDATRWPGKSTIRVGV